MREEGWRAVRSLLSWSGSRQVGDEWSWLERGSMESFRGEPNMLGWEHCSLLCLWHEWSLQTMNATSLPTLPSPKAFTQSTVFLWESHAQPGAWGFQLCFQIGGANLGQHGAAAAGPWPESKFSSTAERSPLTSRSCIRVGPILAFLCPHSCKDGVKEKLCSQWTIPVTHHA